MQHQALVQLWMTVCHKHAAWSSLTTPKLQVAAAKEVWEAVALAVPFSHLLQHPATQQMLTAGTQKTSNSTAAQLRLPCAHCLLQFFKGKRYTCNVDANTMKYFGLTQATRSCA